MFPSIDILVNKLTEQTLEIMKESCDSWEYPEAHLTHKPPYLLHYFYFEKKKSRNIQYSERNSALKEKNQCIQVTQGHIKPKA